MGKTLRFWGIFVTRSARSGGSAAGWVTVMSSHLTGNWCTEKIRASMTVQSWCQRFGTRFAPPFSFGSWWFLLCFLHSPFCLENLICKIVLYKPPRPLLNFSPFSFVGPTSPLSHTCCAPSVHLARKHSIHHQTLGFLNDFRYC